ncbi:MAG: geranylgeranyl reductase [Acidimicrobiia bacterium]|nr:MAG: geranylgeranyl reductase [Acidimicrobiia bacterium]
MAPPVDVLVVGAGPAGAAAAATAARLGLRTVVCDRAGFPRDKTCGDGLTTQALRLLERLGLGRDALDAAGYQPVRETVLVSPAGRRVTLPLPADGEHAGVVTRLGLDERLVALARAAGAEVRTAVGVADVVADADGVKARTADGGTIEARHLVAADGHWSAVRRALRPEAPADLGTWHAARQYFDGVDDDRLWVIFERDLLPGYAWVFPLPGGGANVGFGVLRARRRGRELKALWQDVIARRALRDALGRRARPRGPVRAWPIPTAYAPERLADGRVLYVGDAAAVVDPMTGEGIAQAIETGILAAEAIARGGDVANGYRDAVERALGRDLRFAARLQRVLASPRRTELTIRAIDACDWTRRSFARWMFEGYPRAVLLTPDRWHRRRFTAPGAYARVNAPRPAWQTAAPWPQDERK